MTAIKNHAYLPLTCFVGSWVTSDAKPAPVTELLTEPDLIVFALNVFN